MLLIILLFAIFGGFIKKDTYIKIKETKIFLSSEYCVIVLYGKTQSQIRFNILSMKMFHLDIFFLSQHTTISSDPIFHSLTPLLVIAKAKLHCNSLCTTAEDFFCVWVSYEILRWTE